ncbi:MAG: T9SS type A sorting domain-containing protein [Saprospiraceae bacterium]
MRKILAFHFVVCFLQSTLPAQPGFNRIYDAAMIGNKSFDKIFVDQDTIIAFGVGYEPNSPQGIALAKMDSFGNLMAQNFILDSLGDHLAMDFLRGNVIKTSKGYYAFFADILGRGATLLVQIDNKLNVQSAFELPDPDEGYTVFDNSILETHEGGFLISGLIARENFKYDGLVRRIDKYGNLLWFKYYGGYHTDEGFGSVLKINDNRFILGGGDQARGSLWAIDSNGIVLDQKIIQQPILTAINGLIHSEDGGLIARGHTYLGEGPWGSMSQAAIMKFDSALQLEWMKSVGPSSTYYNNFLDIEKTPDGHYIVAGERTAYGDPSQPSDDWGGWLYKFSAQGDSIWSRADNAPPGYDATGEFVYGGVGVLSSGSIVAGGRGDIDNKFVGWVVKVTADGCLDTLFCQTSGVGEVMGNGENGSLQVFPNPASTSAEIYFQVPAPKDCRFLLYDLAGRLVHSEPLTEGASAHTLSLTNYPNGWYFVCITENGRVLAREKIAVLH